MQWGAEVDGRLLSASSCALHYDERRYQQALVYDAAGMPVTSADGDAPRHRRRDRPPLRHRRRARSARAPSAPTTPTTRAPGHRTTVGARVDVHDRAAADALRRRAIRRRARRRRSDDEPDRAATTRSAPSAPSPRCRGRPTATGEVSYGAQGVGGLLVAQDRARPRPRHLRHRSRCRRIATIASRPPSPPAGASASPIGHGNARATLFAEDQFRDGPLVGTGTSDGGRAHMLDRRRSTCRSASASSSAPPSSAARSRRRARRWPGSPPISIAPPAPPTPRYARRRAARAGQGRAARGRH